MKPDDEFATVMRFGAPLEGPRTFVCFGVARGGTSAVAGMMRKLGINMGEDLDNTHEDRDFIGKPNPARVAAITERNKRYQVWGWKDPNAANYLHAVEAKLRNPHYICVYRDAAAIGIAQKRWHNRRPRFAMGEIFGQQHKNLIWLMDTTAPCLVVSYEKILLRPEKFALELADFVGTGKRLANGEANRFLRPGEYKDVA